MKVTPWKLVRSRASKLDIELERIREFKGVYGIDRLAINVVEGHPKRPEPFWQISIDEWCCHIVKEPGCTTLTLTWAGEGIWKGPVATSDIAGVVLGSLRTAIKVEERRDDVLQAVAKSTAEAFAGELGDDPA